MIKNLVRSILINTAVLVIIALWIPLGGLQITPLTRAAAPYILLMGAIFRTIFHVAKPILGFLTTPINWVTLGLASVLLNMLSLYGFMYLINTLGLGINVQLGGIEQTFILSIIISVLTLVLKKIT